MGPFWLEVGQLLPSALEVVLGGEMAPRMLPTQGCGHFHEPDRQPSPRVGRVKDSENSTQRGGCAEGETARLHRWLIPGVVGSCPGHFCSWTPASPEGPPWLLPLEQSGPRTTEVCWSLKRCVATSLLLSLSCFIICSPSPSSLPCS